MIDTPAASKLGENRALYYSEEENRIEKFRPYGLPELEWLEEREAAVRGPPASGGQITVRRTAASATESQRRPAWQRSACVTSSRTQPRVAPPVDDELVEPPVEAL